MGVALAIIIVALVLIGLSVYLNRRRKALEAELGIEIPSRRRREMPAPAPAIEVDHPRPELAEFHVEGHTARVRFDVPLPEGEPDEILVELLVGEAIEVMREKRHSLPLSSVTEVVALAGRGEVRQVGKAKLDQPGALPPRAEGVNILNLSSLSDDPLVASFSTHGQPDVIPDTKVRGRPDELRPFAEELHLPRAVATGLRAQGIDPTTVAPGELVVGLLRLFGYQIAPAGLTAWMASKAGERTYVVEDKYRPGDHPELDESVIRKFMIEFGSVGANRGMLVTDKYGPFEIYELERKNPKIRFVTRHRLQKMVDSLSLS
ncbi:MAG: hypothetical protein ACT4OP_02365 [Actinomycetota bacterium]